VYGKTSANICLGGAVDIRRLLVTGWASGASGIHNFILCVRLRFRFS
jgi:hypothetical protein